MDLGTPPESGGETFIYLFESIIKVKRRTFPRLDQESLFRSIGRWLSMRNEWKVGVVEIQASLSSHIMEI